MHHFSLQVFLLIALLIHSLGCAFSPRESHSQDLAKLISPAKDSVILNDKKALALPATVAVLMVPGNNKSMIPDSTLRIAAEELKKDLLKKNHLFAMNWDKTD